MRNLYPGAVIPLLFLALAVAFVKLDADEAEREYVAAENAAVVGLYAKNGRQPCEDKCAFEPKPTAPYLTPRISACDEACKVKSKAEIAKVNEALMEVANVRRKARTEAMFKHDHDFYVAPVEAGWNDARRIWGRLVLAFAGTD